MEGNQNASREARRFLADHVRSDWNWPPITSPGSSADPTSISFISVTETQARHYGTSSPSASEDETNGGAGSSNTANPYKFDSPEGVGTAVTVLKEERRRKRKRREVEEMAWNEGLACFVRRRDAWTGVEGLRAKRRSHAETAAEARTAQAKGSAAEEVGETNSAPAGGDERMDVEPDVEPAESTEPTQPTDSLDADSDLDLVPLARPFLPHNPIRQGINPKSYSEIYSKVVLSSRSPSVPINLADMTRAIVQGWKDAGEWPPKSGPLEPLAGSRRKAVTAAATSPRADRGGDGGAFLAHHPHVKRGVESVRRVFRLSGSHGSGTPQPPVQGGVGGG